MPVHDFTRVDAGIFHDFHHAWIEEIKRALNSGVLPADYYALAEQHAAGFGPDVLTLQGAVGDNSQAALETAETSSGLGLLLAKPPLEVTAETDMEFYRRKQNNVVVRHVSGDRIVAMVEVVSPANKNSRRAIDAFVQKAAQLIDLGIHQLILDLFPPGPRDPNGIHGLVWDEITSQAYHAPPDRPLTLVAYETDLSTRAYVKPVAVREALPEMPLFLTWNGCVHVPLEATYDRAFSALPRRWQRALA